LLERQRREESARTLQQRIADAVTRFTGSMAFIYVHLAIVVLLDADGDELRRENSLRDRTIETL